MHEQPLSGGLQSSGLVRIGDTVRRPRRARSGYTQAVLRHLEAVGFDGAPRALGYDQQGRENVTFIDGTVFNAPPYLLCDAKLVSAVDLIRGYHDASATSSLRGDGEVVCHGDLGPHNTVFRGDIAVALIDWDGDLMPGSRAASITQRVGLRPSRCSTA